MLREANPHLNLVSKAEPPEAEALKQTLSCNDAIWAKNDWDS